MDRASALYSYAKTGENPAKTYCCDYKYSQGPLFNYGKKCKYVEKPVCNFGEKKFRCFNASEDYYSDLNEDDYKKCHFLSNPVSKLIKTVPVSFATGLNVASSVANSVIPPGVNYSPPGRGGKYNRKKMKTMKSNRRKSRRRKTEKK